MVAVEVTDEDGLDLFQRDAGLFEMGQDHGRGVEQVTTVEEEAAPVAAGGERVP